MVSSNNKREESRVDEGFNRRDRELIYRALVELSSDIGDLEKMLANFLYSSFTNQGTKLPTLPELSSGGLESATKQIVKFATDIETPLGIRNSPKSRNRN